MFKNFFNLTKNFKEIPMAQKLISSFFRSKDGKRKAEQNCEENTKKRPKVEIFNDLKTNITSNNPSDGQNPNESRLFKGAVIKSVAKKRSALCCEENVNKRLKIETTNDLKINVTSNHPSDDQNLNESQLFKRAAIKSLAKKNSALSANIGLTWFEALEKEFSKEYFIKLSKYLEIERSKYTTYPPEKDVYFWTNTVKIRDVKIVILGQDPYHGPGQAHGLAFSVRKGINCPPSLINIYKEIESDIENFQRPKHGFLYGWASQGVLLLNTCLTVRAGNANSHQKQGWENLTDAVIKWLSDNLSHLVFMLWGGNAKSKVKLIKKEKHLILTAAHPSPLSAHQGFFGCRHFSKANEFLKKHNKKPIDWSYLP